MSRCGVSWVPMVRHRFQLHKNRRTLALMLRTRLPKPKPTSGPTLVCFSVLLSTCRVRSTFPALQKLHWRIAEIHCLWAIWMCSHRRSISDALSRAFEEQAETRRAIRPRSRVWILLFHKPGQKAELKQTPVQVVLFKRELAVGGRTTEWLVAFKSSAAKGITAWSNDVCNSIEHQSILITAMLTIPSGGWFIRAWEGSVCVYLVHGVASERISPVPWRGRERQCRRAEVPKKRVCCASGDLAFFRCLCAETWPNGNRCYSLPSQQSRGKRKRKKRVRQRERERERCTHVYAHSHNGAVITSGLQQHGFCNSLQHYLLLNKMQILLAWRSPVLGRKQCYKLHNISCYTKHSNIHTHGITAYWAVC